MWSGPTKPRYLAASTPFFPISGQTMECTMYNVQHTMYIQKLDEQIDWLQAENSRRGGEGGWTRADWRAPGDCMSLINQSINQSSINLPLTIELIDQMRPNEIDWRAPAQAQNIC